MKDTILVNICADHTWECATSVIGRTGEAGTAQFKLNFTKDEMCNCTAYLDFKTPSSKKFRSSKLNIANNVALYDVPAYLLKDSGKLEVQLILEKESGEVWESNPKLYHILDSINGCDEIPNIPVGKFELTDTEEHEIKQYAYAQVKDANLVPNKILTGTTILGVEGTHNCDGEFNLQEKNSTVEENGTHSFNCDPEYDGLSKINVTVDVKPNLQEGTFEITKNGEYEAEPEIGYDGLSKAKLKVNVTPNLQEKTATANGNITADEGYDGLSGVNVQVYPRLQYKKATENGTVYPDKDYDGLSSVEVNVPETIPEGYLLPEGTKEITQNGDHDVSKYARAYVKVFDSQPILQQKVVEITENGETIIQADSNYDALSKVQVIVDVPETSSGAELNIAYGETEPSDTSKLWVKIANEPSKVEIGNSIAGVGAESVVMSAVGLPTYLSDCCCGAVGTKIYIFGGKSSSAQSKIYIYDTETDTITTSSATLPVALESATCGVVGTKCYIFGGKSNSSIYIYDTETNTITTSSAKTSTLYGMGCGVVGTKIYLFGGQSGEYSGFSKVIYVYNTEDDTVNNSSSQLSQSLSYMYCGVVGTKIYLFGGDYSSSGISKTIYTYDTETNVFKSVGSLPTAIANSACGVVGTKIYLFGEDHATGSTMGPDTKIYIYDTETNTTSISKISLINSTCGARCATVNNRCYIIGNKANSTYGYAIQIFSPYSTYAVENGTLFLHNKISGNKVSIIKSENVDVEIEVEKVLLGNSENVGEEVEAFIHKAFTEQQNYYTSSATQLEAGTELTASVDCNIGDLVVACIATRDTLTISEGWELVSTSNVNSTDTYGQRLSWAYTIAEDTTVSITVTQASEQRLYINMVALQGAGDVVDNGYSYRDDATSGSLTVEKPSGLVLWGMTNHLGIAGNKWSSSNGIPVIQIDASLTPRLGLGLDQTEETSVTLEFSNGACPVIVGCLKVQGMSKFYSKYEVYKWEKI